MAVGELNVIFSLAIKEYDDAISWCEWCSTADCINENRKKMYRCIETLLKIEHNLNDKRENFLDALIGIFGTRTLDICEKIIAGTECFYHLILCDDIKKSNKHRGVLEVYGKCRQAKKQQFKG